MSQESDTATSFPTYDLTCTDCSYEATVVGTVYEALDVADAHQAEHGDPAADHFVNLERQRDE